MLSQLRGILPPMTTPFDEQGMLDLEGLRAEARWLLDQGVHGLVAGGSTGEGHALNAQEITAAMATIVDEVDGALPVVAGLIVNSTRAAVTAGQAIAAIGGVCALQVTPVHYLFRPDDDAMLQHFRTITEETGLPVIIYNVVPWTYLSPELLGRIMREVEGVVGVKQSAGDLKLLADLLLERGEDDLIFTAVDALLYPSFALGSRGAIAAMLAAAPGPCVELWDAVQAGDHDRALQLHQKLLRLWNALFADNLPANVKFAQSLQGVPSGWPRTPMPSTSPERQAAIETALANLGIITVQHQTV